MKMLLDYAHNSFLHLFLHDVVFSRGVDLVKEFLFTLLKSLCSLLLWALPVALLFFQVLLELSVVFFGKRFYCKSNLLLEVLGWVLGEGPSNKLLYRDHILRKGFWLSGNSWCHWISQSNFDVDICPSVLKQTFNLFFRLSPSFNTIFTSFFNHGGTSIEEDSLFSFNCAWLKQIFKWDPTSSISWLHIYCTSSFRRTFCRSSFGSCSCLRHIFLGWNLHKLDPTSLFKINLLL